MPRLPSPRAMEVLGSVGRWVLLIVVVAVSIRAYRVAGGKIVLASAVGAVAGTVVLLLQWRARPPAGST